MTSSEVQNGGPNDTVIRDRPPTPVFAPALSEHFREKIRPVLNSIDRLRSVGLQNELRLPTVAVVGDQSVGKSSVLEAISGVDLPRGIGIVTRCPLQLSMRSRPEGQWTGRICYTNSQGQRIEHSIAEKSQVNEFVKNAQNEITGSSTGVSEEQIDLTIESADVSDLTLIDLPGIARYSETNANINETTKDLIRSYIDQKEVIVLAVVPCHVDIETVEAIALAKEVDPDGVRTIGVMTCPDLTNPGSEDDVMAILRNMGRVRLSKGFVMVKCRSPKELKAGISLSEVSELETQFFAEHRHFGQISKDLVGTRTLADKLTDELFRAVVQGMSKLEDSIKTKLTEYESELKQLSDSLCDTDKDKRYYLMRKLQQFLAKVNAATAVGEGDGAAGSVSKLYSTCLGASSDFGNKMGAIKPPWITNYLLPIPDAVKTEIRDLRGRELPTFTFVFPIVQRIVCKEYLPKVNKHSLRLLELVHRQVSKELDAISRECFAAFPGLLDVTKATIVRVVDDKEVECRADLRKLMSQEGRVFTQDAQFSAGYSEAEKQQKEALEQRDLQPLAAFPGFGSVATTTSSAKRTTAAPSGGLFSAATPVAFVSSRPQQQPDSSRESEAANAERVRLGTGAYLSMASRRVADTVPMLVLSAMLDGVAADVTEEVTKLFADDSDQLMGLLQEDPSRCRRRRHLEEAVSQMKESRAEMLKARRRRLE